MEPSPLRSCDAGAQESIVVITDLEDAAKYPAAQLMETYRKRHQIEKVFQKTTEVFGLQRLIGSSPLAGLFQFAYCLLLHNIVQTLLGYVAEAKTSRPRRCRWRRCSTTCRSNGPRGTSCSRMSRPTSITECCRAAPAW